MELGVNIYLLSPPAAMPVLRSVHEPGEYWLAYSWEGDNFADANRIAFDSGTVLRGDGEQWWKVRAGSSAAHLRALEKLA